MACLILTHLGESVPTYINDCVHQFRLLNPDTPIYLILEPIHKSNPFWDTLESTHKVRRVYTDTLTPTDHHCEFQRSYSGDTAFRKGYWKHVRERFFYVEELMAREGLTHAISMEYDVLIYVPFSMLLEKFKSSHQTLRFVRDNADRGHPAFMYIPNYIEIQKFNIFLASLTGLHYEDMQSLALYANLFEVHYLPVLTEERRCSNPARRSLTGHSASDCSFLSEDSEHFGVLFDSLVVGQWVGGIDSRNTQGHKITRYNNESALYNIQEMQFGWAKLGTLWIPIIDNRPLVMIHIHSKALHCFLSDRPTVPTDDYDVGAVFRSLYPN